MPEVAWVCYWRRLLRAILRCEGVGAGRLSTRGNHFSGVIASKSTVPGRISFLRKLSSRGGRSIFLAQGLN